jgi:hypothetical protein
VRSLTLVIPDAAAAKLNELARQNYRAPRQQAAALLVEAIDRAAGIVRHQPDQSRGLSDTSERER